MSQNWSHSVEEVLINSWATKANFPLNSASTVLLLYLDLKEESMHTFSPVLCLHIFLLLISCHPLTVPYQGLPSAGGRLLSGHQQTDRLQAITGGPESSCWISNQACVINSPRPPSVLCSLMFSRFTNTVPVQSWSKFPSPASIADTRLDHPPFQWLGTVQKAISSTANWASM